MFRIVYIHVASQNLAGFCGHYEICDITNKSYVGKYTKKPPRLDYLHVTMYFTVYTSKPRLLSNIEHP